MTKVVIVTTSAGKLGDHETGLWLEECAAPYYIFKDAGYEVVLSSIQGGAVPLDQASITEQFFTKPCQKFMHDPEAVGALSHTKKLSTVDFASGEINAVFFSGGHGTCVDYDEDPVVKSAIETMHSSGKVVASVCHGPTCLVQCHKPDGKTPLVSGMTVSGFTDSEEKLVGMSEVVPFLLESKLRELGANFAKTEDFHSICSVDENLVTGQNPQSSEETAEAVVKLLSA